MKRPGCNITGVIGASQTGKGLYCHARLASPYSGLTLVWSPLEQPNGNDRYAEVLRAPKVGSIPALVDAIEGGARAVVYVPVEEKGGGYGKQFDRFCRIVRAVPSARVLVEELSRVTTASWAPTSWQNLSTAGAHAGLELIGTAQAPTMIDKAFLGNCTEIRCYRVNEESHARTMQGKMGVEWETLMNLPDRHYWHRWKSPAPRNEQGIQPLPGERPKVTRSMSDAAEAKVARYSAGGADKSPHTVASAPAGKRRTPARPGAARKKVAQRKPQNPL